MRNLKYLLALSGIMVKVAKVFLTKLCIYKYNSESEHFK